jgi:hypothetical protein
MPMQGTHICQLAAAAVAGAAIVVLDEGRTVVSAMTARSVPTPV